MNINLYLQLFFILTFMFLFCWQIILLLSIKNADASSKIRVPSFWLALTILGVLFSFTIMGLIVIFVMTRFLNS